MIDIILNGLKGEFVELKLQTNNRFFFIYGKILSFDDKWIQFFDRIDGKVGIRKDTLAGIRKADPGFFKMSIEEFDRKLDKASGLR